MTEEHLFEIVLQTIATGLLEKILAESDTAENIAMENLYTSSLYAALERENTKLWHCSVPRLYALYQHERVTGTLVLPDY